MTPMNKVFACVVWSFLFCFVNLVIAQEKTDTTAVVSEVMVGNDSASDEPEVDMFTPMPDSFLLSPAQLAREPWIYSMDEAMRNPMKVYKLSLKNERLKEFPRDISRFPNLQILDMSHNKIRHVPPSIVDLPHLEKLILFNNKIKSLPEEFRYLEHLQSLYLGRNRLVQIPSWVGGLSKLRIMDISFNHLTKYEIGLVEGMIPHCEVSY